jgi:hypothetical protein
MTTSFNPEQIGNLNQELGFVEPAYVRLPKWGARCPFTGLTRSALDLLTRAQALNNFRPPVRSKLLRQTGQKAGIKLIDYRSLRAYLDALPDGSRGEQPQAKPESAISTFE